MSKLQDIRNLVQEHAVSVSSSPGDWMDYMDTASRLYRYSFSDQLLIHAQRPDATACASLELWNEKMLRWVNRGARGIALFDETWQNTKLRYVFDISDTHMVAGGRSPYLWKMQEHQREEILTHLAEKEHLYYVHPTSDRYTVGGQGTISLEILDQCPQVEQIVVPIGGGGLITGIALTMKTLKPSVKIYGVMPAGSAVYVESRRQGQLVTLDHCSSMADAVVRKTGEEYLYPYIEKYVDDIFTVTEDSIRQAVRTACLYGKLTLEGSGALALAALLEKKCPLSPGTVLICSGGNIDKAVLDLCMQA